MCALFGWLDFKGKIKHKYLKKFTQALANAAEERGTDASGISYVQSDRINIYKKPKPAHKIKFDFPVGTTAIMGHTRLATQGNKQNNWNNHPFYGEADKAFTDRYKVVQNEEAFAFTDNLLGEGVRYETAGSLQNGKKIWLLAKLPDKYIIEGEQIEPYLVFSSSHDGSGAIKVAMTPVRVVCQNTLNVALANAKRVWSTVHVGDLANKMDEAHNTLLLAEKYMGKLGTEFSNLRKIKLSDTKVMEYIEMLLPMDENPTAIHKKNIERIREDMKVRYFDAPDLKHLGRNGYRFINAVSDFATHAKPLRETANYRENVFAKTIEGNPLIDKAYNLVIAAA